MNSNGLKTLRSETIKLLEESIGSMLFDMGLSCIFMDMSP